MPHRQLHSCVTLHQWLNLSEPSLWRGSKGEDEPTLPSLPTPTSTPGSVSSKTAWSDRTFL